MALVHKSFHIQPQIWKKLRINAEVSDCSVRDLLTHLIAHSRPINRDDPEEVRRFQETVESNRAARRK